MQLERVAAIQQYLSPTNLRSLRRFIGMVGFYARFKPRYGNVVAVLHELKKNGVPFAWQGEHLAAFVSLKRALCKAPVLQTPDFNQEFLLVTDASDLAVSAVLHQDTSGGLAPISYYSRVLTAAERK